MNRVIVIHGGAGYWADERLKEALKFLRELGEKSYKVLEKEGALAAVEYAVNRLEESPIFNAGRGAVPNLLGQIELDAGLMVSSGEGGFVAGVRNVLYAISLAKIVMTETDHFMLVGEGAEFLAKIKGLYTPEEELIVERTRKLWRESVTVLLKIIAGEEIEEGDLVRRILNYYPKIVNFLRSNKAYIEALRKKMSYGDTVGAVAFDGDYLVAGTSTGGLLLKLPGRVGDTPLPGAGTYANEHGACSATGVGEDIIRAMLAKTAVSMAARLGASEAGRRAFEESMKKHQVRAGIILVDDEGGWSIYHTTPRFPCIVVKNGEVTINSVWR